MGDRSTISAAIDSFRAAGREGDLDAFMDHFFDDAVWMLDDRSIDASKTEARQYFEFLNDHYFDQKISKDEIQVFDDWGYARVTFDGYLRPKNASDSEPVRVFSRHFMILRPDNNGTWKIARDVWILPVVEDRR